MKLKGTILLLCFNCALFAQDMQFTQFFASPLYLNPAFTGANVCSRVTATYRNQWPGINKTYSSYMASYDHSLVNYNSGIGCLVTNDVAGTGKMKTTTINGLYSYDVTLTRKIAFRMGINAGVVFRSINFNDLVFGDQIARGGNVQTIEDPTQSRIYFDLNAGALLYSKKYWVGFSAFHLTRPDESLLGQNTILPAKYSVHGGMKIALNDRPEEEDMQYLSPAFHYRNQQNFDQLDIGLYYSKGKINAGLWYRGIPVLKAYKPGYPNNDAIAVMVGFTVNKMNIGYSYDITISQLARYTYGAHELTISHQFCYLKAKKRKPKMIVPCPKF